MQNERDPKAIQRLAIINRLQMVRQAEVLGAKLYTLHPNATYEKSAATPSVTILITLYNYGRYIKNALDSVLNSDLSDIPAGIDILVVDDCSTDDSVRIVEEYIAELAAPVCLVRKTFNTGVCDARNLGLKLARALYVFILDADNWIYPHCLAKHYAAIAGTNNAAAYGIIAKIEGSSGKGVGLLSQYEWDVRQLIRAPYIDAMAMLDRQAILKLGGYSTNLIEYGWNGVDDYDLWLRVAQAGYSCRFVPEILSGYRVDHSSMMEVTMMYRMSLFSHFAKKFADLLSRYEDLDKFFDIVPVYEGHLDSLTSYKIAGWAWNKCLRDTPVKLDIFADGELLATILANDYRHDIYENGVGNGWHGFDYVIPDTIKDGKPHLLQVCIAGRTVEIKNSPQWLAAGRPPKLGSS